MSLSARTGVLKINFAEPFNFFAQQNLRLAESNFGSDTSDTDDSFGELETDISSEACTDDEDGYTVLEKLPMPNGIGAAPKLIQPDDLNFDELGTERTVIMFAEHRAISLTQMRLIRKFINKHAGPDGGLQWHDLFSFSQDGSILLLNKYTISLYAVRLQATEATFPSCYWMQANDWIIKASTRRFKCSLVELFCPPGTEKQSPTYFISHVWRTH